MTYKQLRFWTLSSFCVATLLEGAHYYFEGGSIIPLCLIGTATILLFPLSKEQKK